MAILDFQPLQIKYEHFFSTLRGTFLTSQVTSYEGVLGGKVKTVQANQGWHHYFRYEIALKSNNTFWGQLEHFWQVYDFLCSSFGEKLKIFWPIIRGQVSHGFLPVIPSKWYNTFSSPPRGTNVSPFDYCYHGNHKIKVKRRKQESSNTDELSYRHKKWYHSWLLILVDDKDLHWTQTVLLPGQIYLGSTWDLVWWQNYKVPRLVSIHTIYHMS